MTVLDHEQQEIVLAEEPVRMLEGVGVILEQLQTQVITHLGQVSLHGANETTIDWINRVSDTTERIRDLTDFIFLAVNNAHDSLETAVVPVVEAEPEPLVEQVEEVAAVAEQAAPDATETHLVHELLTFAMRNPGFRAEELRAGGNGFSSMDAAQIRAARKLVISHLSASGVTAEWTVEGKTRGSRYTLAVHEGHDTIVQLLTLPQAAVEAQELPQSEVIAEPKQPELEEAQQLSVPEQPVYDAARYTAQEATLEELSFEEIVAARPMRVKEILFAKYGVAHLPPQAFEQFRAELRHAVNTGQIQKLQNNGLYAHPSYQANTQTKEDVERMLKDLRRDSGIQALIRKPKQRARGRR